jgi:hypothetical protein
MPWGHTYVFFFPQKYLGSSKFIARELKGQSSLSLIVRREDLNQKPIGHFGRSFLTLKCFPSQITLTFWGTFCNENTFFFYFLKLSFQFCWPPPCTRLREVSRRFYFLLGSIAPSPTACRCLQEVSKRSWNYFRLFLLLVTRRPPKAGSLELHLLSIIKIQRLLLVRTCSCT